MSVRRSVSNQNSSSVQQEVKPDVGDCSAKDNEKQLKKMSHAQQKDSCKNIDLNSTQTEELIKDVIEPVEGKIEPNESVPESDCPDKKDSATTKALEKMNLEIPDRKRLKKGKIPMAVRRKKLNQQLSKLLMPKNALILLHEFKPGCVYKVKSQPYCIPPSFTAQVEYGNAVLGTGKGLSKAQAKNSAAENAIKTIVSRTLSKPWTNAQSGIEGEVKKMEEDEDTPENLPWAGLASLAIYKMFSEWQSLGTDFLSLTRPVSKEKLKLPNLSNVPKKELPPNAAELHPTAVLNMMHQGLTAVEIEREDGPNCRVKMGYSIDGKMFTGEGRNKKEARKEAAKAVLKDLHGLTYPC